MTAVSDRIIAVPQSSLIISRTDMRGVIQSVNEAFIDISGYATEELINAPHKIVRHPDMPKGVFQLLWDRLKDGRPVAGYVKNKCKNGDAYWVFAIITPLDGGFMSMRIRPDPTHVATIEKLYKDLRTSERDGTLSPSQSARKIDDAAVELGFTHYMSFITQQLTLELTQRDAQTGKPINQKTASIASLMKDWRSAWADCDDILMAYESFDLKPMNMRIQSGHLKSKGVALSVIASNFAAISSEINTDLANFSHAMETVTETILDCLFLANVHNLITEASELLQQEGHCHGDQDDIFGQQNELYAKDIALCEGRVLKSLTEFLDTTEKIKRQLSALSVTRVMCAIEVAQLSGHEGDDLTAIIEDLDTFQTATRIKLGGISVRLIQMRSVLTHHRAQAAA